ncbi:MAG: hypothetical protein ACJAUC_002802 [Planctomycetota bacterium]|jgi:hypothetical protein
MNGMTKTVGAAAMAMALAGCQGFYDPIEELVDHEQPLVSVPANVGAFVMGVVGVPVAVVALPISVPISVANDAALGPLAPMFAVAQVGAIVLGGLPWLVLD